MSHASPGYGLPPVQHTYNSIHHYDQQMETDVEGVIFDVSPQIQMYDKRKRESYESGAGGWR